MRILIPLLLTAVVAHAAVSPEKIENVRGLLRDRKLDPAESAANALVAAHPADAEVHALLGAVRLAKGDADGAVKACEKAVGLAPKDSELHRQLGDAYSLAGQKAGLLSKMGWGKKVIAAYEKAVALDPENLAARSSLASVYLMAPAMMGGGSDKAYAQAAEIKKRDAHRGHVAYAILYSGEKKYAEAFAETEEVLKAAPDHYAALFQFGRAAVLSGERLDRGMDALQKCLKLPPAPGAPGHDAAHWRLGVIHEKKGDKKAARAAYEASLKLNPKFQQAIDALKKLD
ncbi:MAG: tetratricopeptide repeat protein [Opitutae bacterium]|nr:tetratricopeptide repeat protein [Opitutae bacterium]